MGLLGKLCEFVGKIVCKGVWSVCKFVWKIGYALYRRYKEKKAANGGNSDVATVKSNDVLGPDESVQITSKEKFANLTDDELRLLLEKMTDNAVKVDAHPELEKVLETYGADQEVFKQEITDELKRRGQE